ncbi:hypothetical protein P0209_22780, partial [Escherichia coli]|uniref:hypothetical protein n=1 Tax=Escherichia coli TaxID=562 RepID=UPI0034D70479
MTSFRISASTTNGRKPDAKIFKESSFNENCSAITGGRSAIYECICNDSGADVDIPGSDNTGTENAKWHLNRSQFGIRIDHDLASISDHS